MYRTVAQIDSLTSLLANWFPQFFTRLQLPETSVEGRPAYALCMRAGGGNDRRAVLLVGGTHARELMNPDAILELAVDLLVSYSNGTNVVYGGRTWLANDVRILLETIDIWLLPCVNPDGRNYVMTVDDLWRKNRRDNPGTTCDGVDLNRNLDIVWGVAQGQTSCSPCSDVYCGPSAFSEPETRNVKHLLDTLRVVSFCDVHSYSELVLYPWGHAATQTTDPSQRFTGLPTGTCTPSVPPAYQEFMHPRDLLRFETVGQQIVDDVAAVRGRFYTLEPSRSLYATTGTHSDYAYSRHIANPNLNKTYGFTFETGPWAGNTADSFHPADPTLIKRDAKAAMLTLVQQSICAIELIGLGLFDRDTEVSALRSVRDDLLATTAAGREWIALFERIQVSLVSLVLRDKRLFGTARSLLEIAGRAVTDESSTVSGEDVERATVLIGKLRAKSKSKAVQSDLHAIVDELGLLAGRRTDMAIATLMRHKPKVRRIPATGKSPKTTPQRARTR